MGKDKSLDNDRDAPNEHTDDCNISRVIPIEVTLVESDETNGPLSLLSFYMNFSGLEAPARSEI